MVIIGIDGAQMCHHWRHEQHKPTSSSIFGKYLNNNIERCGAVRCRTKQQEDLFVGLNSYNKVLLIAIVRLEEGNSQTMKYKYGDCWFLRYHRLFNISVLLCKYNFSSSHEIFCPGSRILRLKGTKNIISCLHIIFVDKWNINISEIQNKCTDTLCYSS